MKLQLLPDWKNVAKTSWAFRLWSAAVSVGVLWQGADAIFDYPKTYGEWAGKAVLALGAAGVVARLLDQHATTDGADDGK